MASIKKIQGKGGVSFKITVTTGRDKQGKQIRHYMTWKPPRPMTARQMEKEAQRVASDFERDLFVGYEADNRQTFAEYAEYVYSLREQRGDKPQTLARVRRQTDRICEYIGNMKLADIRPKHLNALYKKLAEPGANRWRIFAAPAVDFKELVGSGTYNDFAEKAGVYGRLICRLCNNQYISRKNAAIIEKNLGRKDLFKIVGTDQPLAPGTIRDYHGVIYTVLAQAEREMILPYNAAAKATLPAKKRVRKSDALQPDQIKAILAALEKEPIDFRTMIHLFIVTGARRGEIMGLKWSKIDFDRREILIDTCLNYLPKKGIFEGPTKTDTIRRVSIPASTVTLLKKYKAWQARQRLIAGENWQNNDYIFTRQDGTAKNPNYINWQLCLFCEKYGFPHINPHLFRHSVASILLSSGVDVLTVANMLGHADVSTTMDIYAHEIQEARRKTADCIAEKLLTEKNA